MITLHWLRPEWVWSALPILLCLWLHLRQQRSAQQWQQFIDPGLLPHLLEQPQGGYSRRLWPVFLAGLLCWLALMGPSWQRLPSPVLEDRGGLAIVLDLSPSMLAEDLQPSRLQRAKYAIRDLLALRADGQTGLVASAGDAFVVAPLTDDGNTLNTLLPSLHPAMMPVQGSNPLSGLVQAQQLLDNAGSPSGHILLIGDGFSAQQLKGLEGFVDQSSYPVSIIGVGSEQGAPIPLPEGGFLRDSQGNTIVASMPEALMQALARKAGGQYINLSAPLGDSALRKLAAGSQQFEESTQQQTFEQWQDGGQWLALLLLPFALLAFRRGAVLIIFLAILTQPEHSYALDWQHPWKTADQRALQRFQEAPAEAAELFRDPMWRGSAHYRAGNYAAAADAFAERDSADAHYNRGNALAKAGKLDEALKAYDQALHRQPDMADAKTNKALVEQLTEQQQQTGGQGSENEGSENQASENQSSQNKDTDNKEQGDTGAPNQANQGGDPQSNNAAADNNATNAGENPQQSSGEQQAAPSEDPGTDDSDAAPASENTANQKALAEQHAQQRGENDDARNDAVARQSDGTTPVENAKAAPAAGAAQAPLSEEEQAQEQWLRNIPDSSDTLLRNKFQYQYDQRRRQGELPEAENYAPY
ncbi:vWA domain-containing protein [Spongiibacter sp. UBA1325]|uniref:vWA domain-containing protein n=1 Tax=Spongiibacter sp. UBA1325 TaxID=1947543 RepID=UPI00257ECE9D|nr:VWA domain-containing protein [Spongiibacter sp. UBA1325]|tara:strand:+ start:13813 stop:15747 length:1935 start_codon:yes stop_codon:yes gene_type:complete